MDWTTLEEELEDFIQWVLEEHLGESNAKLKKVFLSKSVFSLESENPHLILMSHPWGEPSFDSVDIELSESQIYYLHKLREELEDWGKRRMKQSTRSVEEALSRVVSRLAGGECKTELAFLRAERGKPPVLEVEITCGKVISPALHYVYNAKLTEAVHKMIDNPEDASVKVKVYSSFDETINEKLADSLWVGFL